MVPEGRKIFSNLTVRENLIMGAFALNTSRWFEENLEYVFSLFPRLNERFNQLGGTLSGGEQQMLALEEHLWESRGFSCWMSPLLDLLLK